MVVRSYEDTDPRTDVGSSEVTLTVVDPVIPTVKMTLTQSSSDNSVTIEGTSSNPCLRIHVFYVKAGTTTEVPVATQNGSSYSYTLTGLTAGNYEFTMVARSYEDTDPRSGVGRDTKPITVTIPVTEVMINRINADNTITVDQKATVTCSITPSDATDKTVTWSSENTSVAQIDPVTGVVTGISEGTARIRATAKNGKSDSFTLIVKAKDIAVESISLPATASVETGKTITLTATITPDNASNKTINWSSDNKSVATVDKYGLVTGVAAGKATITAEVSGKSKDCTVTVTAPAPTTETVLTLSKNSVNLIDGNSTTLKAVVTPTNTTLTWSVSPLGVITLTGSGNERTITAVAIGTATITVSGGGVSKQVTVTVKNYDPWHEDNIEQIQIKTLEWESGDPLITIVTRFNNGDVFFEGRSVSLAEGSYQITDELKAELQALNTRFIELTNAGLPTAWTSLACMYGGKLAADNFYERGLVQLDSDEYYGIWVSGAEYLHSVYEYVNSTVRLNLAVFTAGYAVYNIVTSITAMQMSINQSKTINGTEYYAYKAQYTGTVWDGIEITQDPYPNTLIPKSFIIDADGAKFWVAPNGTKHMNQYLITDSTRNTPIGNQSLLASFQSALAEMQNNGYVYRVSQRIGPWELAIDAPQTGIYPTVIHAVYYG